MESILLFFSILSFLIFFRANNLPCSSFFLSFFFFPFAHQEFGMESISCSSPFYLFFSFM